MARTKSVSNANLLKAGLKLMEGNGKPLTKIPSRGRAMMFALENGETVRARTCNDHVLIAVADRPTKDATLNIEGTDWLLIVMPESEREDGDVIAYLVPTQLAVDAVRSAHKKWLDTGPTTKGQNKTWVIWFDDNGPGTSSGYGDRWSKYRLDGRASTLEIENNAAESTQRSGGDLVAEVKAAQERISKVAGVKPDSVRITIDFGASSTQ